MPAISAEQTKRLNHASFLLTTESLISYGCAAWANVGETFSLRNYGSCFPVRRYRRHRAIIHRAIEQAESPQPTAPCFDARSRDVTGDSGPSRGDERDIRAV